MGCKIVHAERLGGRNSSVRVLHFEYEDGRKEEQEADLTVGSVVWRREEVPGIILMAYRERYTGKVLIFEEKEFGSSSELDQIFRDLWAPYLPSAYYFRNDEETMSYANHLRRTTNIPPNRIPLLPGPLVSNTTFEIQLIDDYFDRNILSVPKGGLIDAQLRSNWKRTEAEYQHHALAALRLLLAAIETYWTRGPSGRRPAGFSNWDRKPANWA